MKYRVGGGVSASTYIGEFEADSPEQAIEMAYNECYLGLCHQCSSDIQDPEPCSLWAEDELGHTTEEPSEYDNAYQAGLAEGEARGRRAERADAIAYVKRMLTMMGRGHGMARDLEAGRHINAAQSDGAAGKGGA